MQTIDLDICRYTATQSICVKQGDVGRKFKVRLMDCNEQFQIPEGAKMSVWYSGTSGEGNYSEINGISPFQIDGNEIVVEIIAQMVMNKGGGTLCLIMHHENGTQLGMWSIPYFVEAVPGIDSKAAQQYFTALSETAAKALEGAQRAEAAANYFDGSVLPVQNGGTGASTAEEALDMLGAMSNTIVQERHSILNTGMTLDETLTHVYGNMADNTSKIIFVYRGTENSNRFSIGGGTNWMLLITKSTDKWGTIIAWQYGRKHTIIKTRALCEGRWLDWAEHKPSIQFADWPVLWKNYSPGSSFAAQHITLNDGSAFKTIAIQFQHSTDYGHSSFYVFAHYAGCQIYPKAVLGDHRLDKTHRYFNRIDLNTISFQKGYRNDSEDNTAAIPVAVYGVEY